LPLAPFCSPNGLTSISAQSLIAGPPVIIERFVGTAGCPHQENRSYSPGNGDGQSFEVTFNGLSAAWRHRFELHYRRSQDPKVFGASHPADRQLPPERRRSHLVSHLTPDPEVEIENVKVGMTWRGIHV
jgi:hypothetical protein